MVQINDFMTWVFYWFWIFSQGSFKTIYFIQMGIFLSVWNVWERKLWKRKICQTTAQSSLPQFSFVYFFVDYDKPQNAVWKPETRVVFLFETFLFQLIYILSNCQTMWRLWISNWGIWKVLFCLGWFKFFLAVV